MLYIYYVCMYVCLYVLMHARLYFCKPYVNYFAHLRELYIYIYTDLGMSGAYASLFACLVLCVFLWIFSSFVNFSIFCIDMVKRRKC